MHVLIGANYAISEAIQAHISMSSRQTKNLLN